jgi:hypothetical protein
MTGLLDPCIADRLAKLLGMLGSASTLQVTARGGLRAPCR